MRTLFVMLCLLGFVATSNGQGDGAFVAIHDTDQVIKGYRLSSAPTVSTNACADTPTQLRYRIIVTANEYAAGWAALDPARKAAAKAAAGNERVDINARLDKIVHAFALVMLDEVNLIRVNAGLAGRTVAQLKAAILAKYELLP